MDFSVTLLNLAGAVALLLWGVHMVQTGVQRAFGARLRSFLSNALRNRFKAFLAGMGLQVMGLAAMSEPVADLVGRAAYRLDGWLDGRQPTESPSTEFMVCVKKAE